MASAEITFRYAFPCQISKNAAAWWKIRSRFAPPKGTEGSNACPPPDSLQLRECLSNLLRNARFPGLFSRFYEPK